MNTFKLKGSKEFTVQCIGTVKDERGVKHDQWQVTCANFGNVGTFLILFFYVYKKLLEKIIGGKYFLLEKIF